MSPTEARRQTYRSFALTYPQLMDQAQRLGASENDLSRLRLAYELAERGADGFYRAQGVPFICHLVRTASIVLEEGLPMDAVIASLLHASYMMHRFGGAKAGSGARRQQVLASGLGETAESLIRRYDALPWYTAKALDAHIATASKIDAQERQVLIMRLANELEDYLDRAMAYRGGYPYRESIESNGARKVALARALGCESLAQELEVAFRDHLDRQLPDAVRRSQCHAYRLRPSGPLEQAKNVVKRILRRPRPLSKSSTSPSAGGTHV